MRSIMRPDYKGLTLATLLKSLTPICLFILQCVWSEVYLVFMRKGSVYLMLKAKRLTVNAD